MEPPLVPTLANAGIVVSVLLVPKGVCTDAEHADLAARRGVELDGAANVGGDGVACSGGRERKKCGRCRPRIRIKTLPAD